MQNNNREEQHLIEPSVIQDAPTGQRMTLSLLRRRIRAGWYEDDLRSEEANHLLFLRWMVRQGLLSEWDEK